MGRALWEGRRCHGTRWAGTVRVDRQAGGQQASSPHSTQDLQQPASIWRPAWGTERRLEAQPPLSLRCSEPHRGGGGQRGKRVGATRRAALTAPLLGSTSPKPWVLCLTEWLLRCWLGPRWAGVGGTALRTVSCVNSDFLGRGAVRIHAHNCPSEAASATVGGGGHPNPRPGHGWA